MAFPCPHCNQPIRRVASNTSWQHGILGALLTSAMADYECPRCGLLAEEEFSPEVRAQMKQGSWALIGIGAAVAILVSVGLTLYALR